MARAEEPLTVTREQQLEWVRPMETPLFTSLHETPGTNARRVGVLTQDANREAAKLGWG